MMTLHELEDEARRAYPYAASYDGLWIIYNGNDTFHYEWGDANVSRHEAATRLSQLATQEPST